MDNIKHNMLRNMPQITEEELIAHIEDDDFFLVYGNPVLIRTKDTDTDMECVFMSIKYYQRLQKELTTFEEHMSKAAEEKR